MTAPPPFPHTPADRAPVAILGAGIAGLALGIRLQAAGVPTLLFEASDAAGGVAGAVRHEGFVFERGPISVPDIAPIAALWQLSGAELAADCEFVPTPGLVRFIWPDGRTFELSGDRHIDGEAIAAFAPADLPVFEALVSGQRGGRMTRWPAPRPRFQNADLRDAVDSLAFPMGSLPKGQLDALPAIGGGWSVRGGSDRLIAALVRQYERLGGTLLLGDGVTAIATGAAGAERVTCRSVYSAPVSAVASTLGAERTRALLGKPARGRIRLNPAMFTVHLALRGGWPGIPHQTVLLCDDHAAAQRSVCDRGILPGQQTIVVHHPSVTEPSLAPVGHSVLRATITVPNLRQAPLDWAAVGPQLERAVLDAIEQRLIPDLGERLVLAFHTTPADWAARFALPGGTPFGPLTPARSAARALPGNVVLLGAEAGHGAGISDALASAERAAGALLARLHDMGKG